MSEESLHQKKSFFSDKYNLMLLGVLLLALILGLMYFTINKALWWDEAEYLSIAKHWAFGVPFGVSFIRPPSFLRLLHFFMLWVQMSL